MIKDSPGKKQVIVAIVAALLAVIVGGILIYRSFSSQKPESVKEGSFDVPTLPSNPPPAIKKDTIKAHTDSVVADSAPPPSESLKTKSHTKRKIDTVLVVRIDTIVKAPESLTIEEKLKLHKPSRPEQIPEYLRLVYHAMKSAAPSDKDKAIRWGEEGLEFSNDGTILAFIAGLHYQQGRKWDAMVQAEKALNSSSILSTNYRDIANTLVLKINSEKKTITPEGRK